MTWKLEGGGGNGDIAKFGDDTNLFRVLKTKAGCEKLQKDLAKLRKWPNEIKNLT